jgi:hypothetical protein
VNKFALAALLLGVSVQHTLAAGIDLSQVRCEDPEVAAIIEKQIKNATVEGGGRLSSYVTIQKLTKSTTHQATRNKLICNIFVTVSSSGGTANVRGKYTFQQFAGGKLTAEWSLSY